MKNIKSPPPSTAANGTSPPSGGGSVSPRRPSAPAPLNASGGRPNSAASRTRILSPNSAARNRTAPAGGAPSMFAFGSVSPPKVHAALNSNTVIGVTASSASASTTGAAAPAFGVDSEDVKFSFPDSVTATHGPAAAATAAAASVSASNGAGGAGTGGSSTPTGAGAGLFVDPYPAGSARSIHNRALLKEVTELKRRNTELSAAHAAAINQLESYRNARNDTTRTVARAQQSAAEAERRAADLQRTIDAAERQWRAQLEQSRDAERANAAAAEQATARAAAAETALEQARSAADQTRALTEIEQIRFNEWKTSAERAWTVERAELIGARDSHKRTLQSEWEEQIARIKIVWEQKVSEHDASVIAERDKHANEISELKTNSERELSELRASHAAATAALTSRATTLDDAARRLTQNLEAALKETDALRVQLTAQQSRVTSAAELVDSRSRAEAAERALDGERAVTKQQAATIERLTAELKALQTTSDNTRRTHESEIERLREAVEESEQKLTQTETDHSTVLERIAIEHETANRELTESHAKAVSELNASHAREMDAARAECAATVERTESAQRTARERLEKRHSQALTSNAAVANAQAAAVQTAHQTELNAARTAHATELSTAAAAHATELQNAAAAHATELANLRSAHQTELLSALSAHRSEVEAVRAAHRTELEATRIDAQRRIDEAVTAAAAAAEERVAFVARDATGAIERAKAAADAAAAQAIAVAKVESQTAADAVAAAKAEALAASEAAAHAQTQLRAATDALAVAQSEARAATEAAAAAHATATATATEAATAIAAANAAATASASEAASATATASAAMTAAAEATATATAATAAARAAVVHRRSESDELRLTTESRLRMQCERDRDADRELWTRKEAEWKLKIADTQTGADRQRAASEVAFKRIASEFANAKKENAALNDELVALRTERDQLLAAASAAAAAAAAAAPPPNPADFATPKRINTASSGNDSPGFSSVSSSVAAAASLPVLLPLNASALLTSNTTAGGPPPFVPTSTPALPALQPPPNNSQSAQPPPPPAHLSGTTPSVAPRVGPSASASHSTPPKDGKAVSPWSRIRANISVIASPKPNASVVAGGLTTAAAAAPPTALDSKTPLTAAAAPPVFRASSSTADGVLSPHPPASSHAASSSTAAAATAAAAALALDPSEAAPFEALRLDHIPTSESVQLLFSTIVAHLPRDKYARALEQYLLFHWLSPAKAAISQLYAEALLKRAGWENWPLPLLFHGASVVNQSTADESEKKLFLLTCNVYALTLFHHFKTFNSSGASGGGGASGSGTGGAALAAALAAGGNGLEPIPITRPLSFVLGTVFDSMDEYAGWHDDVVGVARVLLSAVVRKVTNSTTEWKHDIEHCAYANLFDLLLFVEQFVLYRPARPKNEPMPKEKTAGLHIDENGALEDLALVESVIVLLTQRVKIQAITENPLHPEMKKSQQKVITKLQKKYQSHGLEVLEYFTAVHTLFKALADGKMDDSVLQKFCKNSSKRIDHASVKVLTAAITKDWNRVQHARKRALAKRAIAAFTGGRSRSLSSSTPTSAAGLPSPSVLSAVGAGQPIAFGFSNPTAAGGGSSTQPGTPLAGTSQSATSSPAKLLVSTRNQRTAESLQTPNSAKPATTRTGPLVLSPSPPLSASATPASPGLTAASSAASPAPAALVSTAGLPPLAGSPAPIRRHARSASSSGFTLARALSETRHNAATAGLISSTPTATAASASPSNAAAAATASGPPPFIAQNYTPFGSAVPVSSTPKNATKPGLP